MTDHEHDFEELRRENSHLRTRINRIEAQLREQTAMLPSLDEGRRRFERLAENLNGMVYRCVNDFNWTMTYVSSGAEALTGYLPEQLIENRDIAYGNLIHPDDRKQVWEGIQADLQERRAFRRTYRIQHASGEERWVWEQGLGVFGEKGAVEALEGYISDITALKESEARYRSLFANHHTIMLIIDPDTDRIVDANPAACTFYGWPREVLIEKHISDINTLNPEQTRAEMALAVSERRSHFLFQHRRADGAIRDVEVYSGPIQVRGRQFLCSIIHDITARRQAESALEKSEALQRAVIAASPVALYSIDPLGNVLTWNASAERIFGWREDEVVGKFLPIVPDNRQTEFYWIRSDVMAGRVISNLQLVRRKKDGTLLTCKLSAAPILNDLGEVTGILGAMEDITAQVKSRIRQQQLEDQLHQAQRLESIGRLAGGVAHDFNNLLAVIMGYSELLLRKTPSNHPHRASLKEIRNAADRAKNLTRQLLAFSRKQVLELKPLDVNSVVSGFERLLRRVLGEDIVLAVTLAAHPLIVMGDSVQLEQVLMNLAVNARDAMADGGTLTIKTAVATLNHACVQKKTGVTPGDYAMMVVSDTGCGMNKATRDRIFEPFFTTKGKDEGTGLGMATSYGIVKQHGGHIGINTKPGEGTTFKIYLPLCVSPVSCPTQFSPRQDLSIGNATILIVEDDMSVRRLATGILRRSGYRVIESTSAEDAVDCAARHDGPLHLVLTDVIMPGMKGPEVYAKICQHHPEASVLYMSGYTDNVIARQGVLQEGIALIQKPFSIQGLLKKVRQVIRR